MQLSNENYVQEYFLRFFYLRPKSAARATRAKRERTTAMSSIAFSFWGFFALLAPLALSMLKSKKNEQAAKAQPALDVMGLYYLLLVEQLHAAYNLAVLLCSRNMDIFKLRQCVF